MASRGLLLAVCASFIASGGSVPEERRLHSDLLAGYNKNVRPVMNESDAVHLAFGVALVDFRLDTASDILQSLVWLRMSWTDMYLRWEPSEYSGIKNSFFNPEMVWVPDICIYNGWDRLCHVTSSASNVIVKSAGDVIWVPPARVSTRCHLDRTNWPRDTATCLLKFGSWTHDGFRINMTLYGGQKELDLSDLQEKGVKTEWEIMNNTGVLDEKYYSCCPEPYYSVSFTLTLRRNEHRTAELAIPVISSAVLMLLSFLVPVTSPQKLTFCWVSVLITVLGLLNMFAKMPSDAHGIASIATFYVTYTALLLIFTVLEVLVLCLSRPRTAPLPRCLRGCLSGLLGKLLCLDTPLFHDYSPEDNEMLDSSQDGEHHHKQAKAAGKSYEWQILAGAFDRICGLAFLLIVAVVLPPNLTWA